MAFVTNSYSRSKGVNITPEDVEDAIYMISPHETPFISQAGRSKATQTIHGWNTRVLATAITNNVCLEGETDAAADLHTGTSKVVNYAQIAKKIVQVTGSMKGVKLYGARDPMADAIETKSLELRRDMEKNAIGVGATGVLGTDGSVAPQMATFPTWLRTNWMAASDSAGGTAAAPTYSGGGVAGTPNLAAVEASTPGTLNGDDIATLCQNVTVAGGKVQGATLLVSPFNKREFSKITGIATRTVNVNQPGKVAKEQTSIVAGVDVYAGDFGTFNVQLDLFCETNAVYLIDWNLVNIAYRRPFAVTPLAKRGDADQQQILTEYTLVVEAESGMGQIRSLRTSLS